MDIGGVGQAYIEHRPYLVDLAFRMLGDIGAAQDVVQETFSRLMRADMREIEDVRGWLVVVTSRLCLDQIKSARSRRERAHDAAEIDYVGAGYQPGDGAELADPADRVTFDDSVRLALLVVLQRLSPAERVVFVLHDIFRMRFDDIAQTVGRTAASCRQLAKRARHKIAAGQDGVRFDVGRAEHRLVTEKFIAACASGNLDGLLEVLAPDVWGALDAGPDSRLSFRIVHGANRVAANLLRFWGPPATLVSLPVGGQPALLGFTGRELVGVLVFSLSANGAAIASIEVIADPRKIEFLNPSP